MMRYFLQCLIGLVGIVLMQFQNARAQYVTIPDANFVSWLQDNYPNCLSGSQLDTTCPDIVNATFVNCSFQTIANLTGIQYFDNLETLWCNDNSLTSLPQLPAFVTDLQCHVNEIGSLPTLPSGLTKLLCYGNLLTELPNLPNTLVELQCGINLLTSLPTLPNSLTKLNCNGNVIATLPVLPPSLTGLQCAYNQLSSLPDLPTTLGTLDCSENFLTDLPTLPNGLTSLGCGDNSISALPTLPDSLVWLWCDQNQITELQLLPPGLVGLYCSFNQLTSLPPLPTTINSLDCRYTLLTSLPPLPYSLNFFRVDGNTSLACLPVLMEYTGLPQFFKINNTAITCLPNVIQHTGYIPAIDTMLICAFGDPCYVFTVCDAPTNPSANNVTSMSALIKWNMENDAVKYRVRVKNMSSGIVNLYFVNAPDTTKSLTNLSANTTYQVKVRSQCSTNGSILSPWSNTITFTTSGATTCIYPTNISATPTSNSTATIVWTPISGAAGYQLRYKQNNATSWNLIPINNGSTSSYSLTSLSPSTTYKYQLRTKCSINPLTWSNFSPIQTFTTPLRLGEEEIINSIQLYPNPSNGTVTFTSNDASTGSAQALVGTLYVYDIVGKEILHHLSAVVEVVSKSKITLTDLPNGLFTYRFVSENGLVAQDKFVVIR